MNYGHGSHLVMRCCGDEYTRITPMMLFDIWRSRQNERHFVDDVLKCIFVKNNIWILIKMSLNFVPEGHINNIPALVKITAWRRPGDKPLSESMMVNLPTHICATRPRWVKSKFAYKGHAQSPDDSTASEVTLKSSVNFFMWLSI